MQPEPDAPQSLPNDNNQSAAQENALSIRESFANVRHSAIHSLLNANRLRSFLQPGLPSSIRTSLQTSFHNTIEKAQQSLRNRWVDYRLSRPYPAMELNEKVGEYGERVAAIYLQRKGYFILERSFRAKSGEIDIIAVWQRRVVVFVEVKTWKHDPGNVGGPSDAVDDLKQEKITRTALMYMKRHLLLESPGRADVIDIVLGETPHSPQIRHFENAFEAVGQYQMFS